MTAKLYVNTDIILTVNIGTGFTIDDVESMSLSFTKSGITNPPEFEGIIADGVVTFNIPDSGGVSEPGTYTVKILMTDTNGNILGLTPSPDYLRFYP